MASEELEILYEDNSIIVCVKPAGVPSQSDRTGGYDMVSRLKNYLAVQKRAGNQNSVGNSGGNQALPRFEIPYIAPVHRLDRPVGGVMVYGKTKGAAAVLSKQVQEHQMTKKYFCVVTGFAGEAADEKLSDTAGTAHGAWNRLVHLLRTDKRTNLSAIATENEPETVRAELLYQVLEQMGSDLSRREESQAAGAEQAAPADMAAPPDMAEPASGLALLEVELLTGRHHQIRVQMTAISEGIWGDTKYNESFAGKKGWYDLALFSHELSFKHPVTGKVMSFTALPKAGGVFDQFAYIQRLRLR